MRRDVLQKIGLSSGSLADALGETHHSVRDGEDGMSYSVFRPSEGSAATVLLIPDVFGRSLFYQLLAARIVAAGYTVVLPELFTHANPVAEGDTDRALKRLAELDQTRALGELENLYDEIASADPDAAVFAMGFSVGGTLSMMLSTRRDLNGAVIFYGFPARRPPTVNAPFVFVDHASSIRCPAIGFWGEDEQRVPPASVDELRKMTPSLPHDFQVVSVPGVGHSFLCFDEDDARYEASSSAWLRAIDFIKINTNVKG